MSVFVLTWNIFLLVIIKYISNVDGNAMLRPVSRGLMWTRRNQVPTNYNYMGVNCGGIARYRRNEGQCGLCGDPFDGPRRHETGGKFATGAIAQTYAAGKKKINVKILINANQGGFIEFRLCRSNGQPETEACFNENLLLINEAVHQGETDRYYVESTGLLHLNLDIPKGLSCNKCVLQWKYITDNMWGRDHQGQGCLGCGHQETFINCADIRIKGWGAPPTRPPTLPPTTTQRITTTTTMAPPPPPITKIATTTTRAPITWRPTTQRLPQTTIYVAKAGNRTDKDEGRRSITPSWTQSGNKVTNSAPKTPLDLHNMAMERRRPMGTRGPPPRPPPSNIPRPPRLSSQHIDALNQNGKMHVHTSNDNRAYIHIHASKDNKPYLYSAPPTTTAASTGNLFDKHRNNHRVNSHDFNHHSNTNNRHSHSGNNQRNNKLETERQHSGGRPYNEYIVTELPRQPSKITTQPKIRSFTRASSFNQRQKSSFNERQGPLNVRDGSNSRYFQNKPETKAQGSNNWYSKTTTPTPIIQDIYPKIKPAERNQYSRYDLSNPDKPFNPANQNTFNWQARRNGGTRDSSPTKKSEIYKDLMLDPMGEPITTTSTTQKPTTPYSRFLGQNRAIPMSRELRTMYNLRNQLKADAEENRFRKPVVFERFTQFRIGKKGKPQQEAYVGGEKVLRVMPPSNELSKPINNPAYMANPVTYAETNVSTNMLGINPEHMANNPSSIHGVDFLGQKPQRNEFAHRKHINTLHKESLPREAGSQSNGGRLPIVAMHDGHGHSNGNRNGVLGLYSHEDPRSLHHRAYMTPSTSPPTTTTPTTTTISPFRRQQPNPNYVFNNGNLPQSQTNQFVPDNQNAFQQPFAMNAQSANKRQFNNIPDIQIQSGQVFEKTMPPVRNDQFGFSGNNQYQPSNQLGNNMQGVDPFVEHLKSQILASVNTANNHQMHGYNPNQFNPQPVQNLQTLQRVNSHPNVLPNSWHQNNQPFQHPGINGLQAVPNIPRTPSLNDISIRLLQGQAMPQAPSSYVFPNIKTQNLFSSHGLQHLFPNNGAQHHLQDPNMQLLLQNLGQQPPQETTTVKPTTTTQPTTTTPTTTTSTTTPTTTTTTTQATIKPSTLDIETASSKELFQELKKFQEVMKKRPLNYEELQRQQALQTQLLKKLYEDQMKRMDPQYASDKKTVAATKPTTSRPTAKTTYPQTTKTFLVGNKVNHDLNRHVMEQQTEAQHNNNFNYQISGTNKFGRPHVQNNEGLNHEASKPTTKTTASMSSTNIQNVESVSQIASSETTGADSNESNKKGALQKRLDKFVNTLANRMNTKVSEAEAIGKLQNVQVAPVSRDAIMKVLREMALDAMRKRKQTTGNIPIIQNNRTLTGINTPATKSQEKPILTSPSAVNFFQRDQTNSNNMRQNEKHTVVFSDRLVNKSLASPMRNNKQMLVSPPSPPFVRQNGLNRNIQQNYISEEPVQQSLDPILNSGIQGDNLPKASGLINQRKQELQEAMQPVEPYHEQFGPNANRDAQVNENIELQGLQQNEYSQTQRHKVPQTLEELRKQQIPVFKSLSAKSQNAQIVNEPLTTRNSKPRQYNLLMEPSTTPIRISGQHINTVTKYPSTKINIRPIESVTETTSFTVRHNTHFNDNNIVPNTNGAIDKPNQRHENTETTFAQKFKVTETVTPPTKTPAPGKRKLTQKAITELGNDILRQMKRLLARRNG